MSKKRDNTLKEIITISKQIFCIYEKIIEAKIENNEDEICKQLEYLQIATEYENEKYQEFDINIDLDETIYNRFKYLLNFFKDYKNSNVLIKQRFTNHLNELLILNPFLSNNSNLEINNYENQISITFQASRDYSISALYFLNQEIENTKNKNIKKQLLVQYHEFIFNQKQLEPYIKKAPVNIETSGRNRCILFNQDEALVNYCYLSFIKKALKENIVEVLQFTDQFLEKNENAKGLQLAYLCLIKSAIIIANDNEKQKLEFKINPQLTTISSKGYHDILATIDSTKSCNISNEAKIKKLPN